MCAPGVERLTAARVRLALEPVDPGVVPLQEWRPDPGHLIEKHEIYHTFVGGVGRKR